MGTKIQAAPAPEPRDLGGEYRDTLQAKLDYMPAQYQSEAEYRPKWAELDLRTLNQSLGGVGGQRGLIEIYRDVVMPTLSQTESQAARDQALSRLGTVEQYGQRATDALLNADPEKRKLADRLIGQANEELSLGAQLDPSLRREIQQAVRGGDSARGMARTEGSAYKEAMFTGLQAEQLRRNRQQFAMGVLGQRQALTGDPWMSLVGQPSQAFAAAPGYAAGAAGMGQAGSMFQPGQYEAGLFGMNYQGALQNQALQTQASMANAQARNAMIGGIIGGVGSMSAGMFSGAGHAGGWNKFWGP